MFYELIHTRCKQGMDIKKGAAVTSEGFKEYACSPELMKDGIVDMPLFAEAVKGTSSYVDRADANNFMEDAYFYYAPDFGNGFIINFHPIPWQKDFDAQGRFMNRPGNFVNHVFAGDFTQANFYTYELFGDRVWDAKEKSYSYYYDEPPKDLTTRILNPKGKYSTADIASFITDGRQDALVKTIAFLIDQFGRDPKEQKYLVIKDESAENIEKWIAAIQSAFSPRIAANIPFATRMDKFANSNKYTVNQEGRYQTQMNLQDPRQIHKFRAMIVGVDERDKGNVNAARPMANSPFVLLDGKEKKANFECNSTEYGYYRLITGFNKEQEIFCRRFLQTFHINKPSEDLCRMYDAYKVLSNIDAQSATNIADALKIIDKYKAENTEVFISICNSLEGALPRLLQQNLIETLGIITWLKKSALVTGDIDISNKLVAMVCKAFEDLVFVKASMTDASKFWQQLKTGEFARELADVMTDKQKLSAAYDIAFDRLRPTDWVIFTGIYLECAKVNGSVSQETIKRIAGLALHGCYSGRDAKAMGNVIELISQDKSLPIVDMIFTIAKEFKQDGGFAQSLIDYVANNDTKIASSDEAMMSFCRKLHDAEIAQMTGVAVHKRLEVLRPQEYDKFLNTLETAYGRGYVDKKTLADAIEAIDKNINPEATDRATVDLATGLINFKPSAAVCQNAAHVLAMSVFSAKATPKNLTQYLEVFENHGFPKVKGKYINAFVKRVMEMQFNLKSDEIRVLDTLAMQPLSYLYIYAAELSASAKKHQNKWNTFMEYVAKVNNEDINEALQKALIDMKHSEKSLNELYQLLPQKTGDFFWHFAGETLEVLNPKKAKKGATSFGKQRDARDDRYGYTGQKPIEEEPLKQQETKKKGFFSGLFGGGNDKRR